VEGPTPEDYDAVVASEGDEITSAKRTDKKKPGANKEKNKKKKEKEDEDEDEMMICSEEEFNESRFSHRLQT
ncbi:hypothetical protein WDU94_013903, partial [Cyamophila willieti]